MSKALEDIVNLHIVCIECVYSVFEDFYLFSNKIQCISATFDQETYQVNTECSQNESILCKITYSKNPYIRVTIFGVRPAKVLKLPPFKRIFCPVCR